MSIRWIFSMIRKMKWLFIGGTLLIILEAQVWIAAVGLQRNLIDDVLLPQNFSTLPSIVFLIGSALLIYSFLHVVAPYCLKYIASRIRLNVSTELANQVQSMPIGRVQQERTATFVHYFSQDIDAISEFIGEQLPRMVQQLAATTTLCIVVGLASPIILIGVILFSSFYILLGRHYGKKFKNQTKEVQKRKAELLVHIEEGIASTREVIAFHRMKWEKQIYDRIFDSYYRSSLKHSRLFIRMVLASDPLKWATNLLILGYGGYLVMNNDLSLGMFIITYQFASQLMDTNLNLFNHVMNLSGQMAHIERVRTILGEKEDKKRHIPFNDELKKLQFKNVDFFYNQKENQILRDVTFHIPIGKKIAVVGASGSGKSTIAQLLIKFYEPSAGQVLINDIPLSQIKRSDWMPYVRIVFQEPYLFPDTILNNLQLGKEYSINEIKTACQQAFIHDFIMTLPKGYETVIGERGITLSGGQRQRLAIARALLYKPKLLILDEATSALDLESERYVQNHIDMARQGKTTLIIAHRLSTILNADEIIVMDQGKVIQQGTHKDLYKSCSQYRELVKADQEASGEAS